MKFGSVCSGIEAASVAWEPIGWTASWFAEIEPFPSAVLANHWPDVPNLGDMTKLSEMVKNGLIAAPDVLVGGTPCQAFSVAGSRASLSDERGQLTLEFVRLIDEINTARSICGDEPAVCIWENVDGVLSTADNAFGCFLGALSGEECELKPAGKRWPDAGCVFGPKRTIAWRIFNAKYFGIPQRRRRVFVVASPAQWINPAAVLFEFDSLQGNSQQGAEKGKGPASAGGPADSPAETSGTNGTELNYFLFEPLSADGTPRFNNDQTVSPTLTRMSGGQRRPCVFMNGIVREFMPSECEALQGFPIDHTKIPYRGKPADKCPAGPRYAACGNSMPVPVMRWIGERIDAEVKKMRAIKKFKNEAA